MSEKSSPKKTAADIPHAAALTPPQKAPRSPFSLTAL